jgi:type I restriction enzyme S subunit
MRISDHWEKAAMLDLYQPHGGLAKSRDSFGRGTEIVDVKTVIHHSFLPDSVPTLVEATKEEAKRYRVKAGDILLNRSSESIEQLACGCIVPEDRRMVYGSYVKCLRAKTEEAPTPFYMAGYLRSAVYRHEVERVSPVYTTRANMNEDRLSEIAVYYPDVNTQEKLGQTLFAIFQYKKQNKDAAIDQLFVEFERFLIEQFITYPILCLQEREERNK